MSRLNRRALAAAAAATASVAAFVGGTLTAPAGAQPSSDDGAGYYEVTLNGGRTIADLRAKGADVTYVRGGKAEVVSDTKGANALRRNGFKVTRRASLYVDGQQRASAAAGTYYGGYHTPAAHAAHNAQVARDYPSLVRVHDIGDSYLKATGRGGHDIQAVCITEDAPNGCRLDESGKPKMVLYAQVHARELVTGELAYRWIDELVKTTDPTLVAVRRWRELWVVPIGNPDGVDKVASNPSRPLPQRKNWNLTWAGQSQCGLTMTSQPGVDLNRNSDFAWNANEGNGNPCAQTFPGKSAVSEPETKAIQGLLSAVLPDKRDDAYSSPVQPGATGVFLSVHAYGNMIIHPYSFSQSVKAPDAPALKKLANSMASSNGYTVGTAPETVGYTSYGSNDDWAYGRRGIAGFTFEVGGSGGRCGGFFPAYSCMNDFWAKNRGAFITAAQAAANPYDQPQYR